MNASGIEITFQGDSCLLALQAGALAQLDAEVLVLATQHVCAGIEECLRDTVLTADDALQSSLFRHCVGDGPQGLDVLEIDHLLDKRTTAGAGAVRDTGNEIGTKIDLRYGTACVTFWWY